MIDRSARLVIALLVLLLIWWVLGALCRSLLTTVDLRAVRDVASERTPAQTTMAHALSWIGSGYVVFPLTLVGCAILSRRPEPALLAVGRRRVKDGVAAAGFLLALGVAASRVYLGVHYPSDVIFGLALGTACAIVASHYVTGPPPGSSTPEPNASRFVAP